MDLFPDGGFVRLRNRERERYLHADEDASGVSLRSLGAVPIGSVIWKAKVWAVEGVNYILLESAACGRYLAVPPNEDDRAPPGHRGVRAVQLDFNSLNSKDSILWMANRVEAGQNYVRLHNDHRCLRANGRHRYWNNLVTVDVRNANDTKMMQWRVEAIPASPDLLPLPSPPLPPCKEGSCCAACGCAGSTPLCRRCARSLTTELVDAGKRRLDIECPETHCFCLECKQIFTGTHSEHRGKTVPLGRFKNKLVAWVTGEEQWRGIFERIETQERPIKPYLVYKPDVKDSRCKVCGDIVSSDQLYGALFTFCTLSCFVAGGGDQVTAVENALLQMDDWDGAIGFCLTCATVVVRSGGREEHDSHDWLRIFTKPAELSPRVIIPDGHPKKKTWAEIRTEGPSNNEVLIRDDLSTRCNGCQKRLPRGCDSCSLECSLDAARREPQFLPRAVQH